VTSICGRYTCAQSRKLPLQVDSSKVETSALILSRKTAGGPGTASMGAGGPVIPEPARPFGNHPQTARRPAETARTWGTRHAPRAPGGPRARGIGRKAPPWRPAIQPLGRPGPGRAAVGGIVAQERPSGPPNVSPSLPKVRPFEGRYCPKEETTVSRHVLKPQGATSRGNQEEEQDILQ
jgi:hypothetical protein